MKLKFEKEVEVIINLISQLPDTVTEKEDLDKPFKILSEFDWRVTAQKNQKPFPSKFWAKLRRQLSFLYEFVWIAKTEARKLQDPKSVLEKEYQILVKSMKDIHTGKALQNLNFIKIALSYGVFYLSDFEVQNLIDNNRI